MDFAPKWVGKALNGVMTGGNYSQTPCGDFWTDSGQHFFDEKRTQSLKRPAAGKPICLENDKHKKDAHRHDPNFGAPMRFPSSIWSPFVKQHVLAKTSKNDKKGDDGNDGDGRISSEHPSPILHAPRDNIPRKGKSLTPIIVYNMYNVRMTFVWTCFEIYIYIYM